MDGAGSLRIPIKRRRTIQHVSCREMCSGISICPAFIAAMPRTMPKSSAINNAYPAAACHRIDHDARGSRGIGARLAGLFRGASNTHADFRPNNTLVGQTVQPRVAEKHLSKLQLSGTGQILGVGNLRKSEYEDIVRHTIPALSLQSAGLQNCRRTPGECIMAALVAARIHLAGTSAAAGAHERLRSTWLDHGLSKQAAKNALEMVKLQSRCQLKANWLDNIARQRVDSASDLLAAQASDRFNTAIDEILASMEKEPTLTRRNDNFYGRLFETYLAEHLASNPDAEMLQARDMVAGHIMEDFDALDPERAASLCRRLASHLKDDQATWQSGVTEVQDFIMCASPDSFRSLMQARGKHSTLAVLWLAVKYSLHSPTLQPMLAEATAFYEAVIMPQRNLQSSSASPRSNMHGLLYGYQRGAHASAATASGPGIRPMDKYLRPGTALGITSHDRQAMHAERAVGIGMSGSANILHHLFRDIAATSAEFPMRSAQVATAAWLAHSGGHSFNEAYSVFGYTHNKDMIPLSYSDFSDTAPAAKAAVDYAFEKILETALKLHSGKPSS